MKTNELSATYMLLGWNNITAVNTVYSSQFAENLKNVVQTKLHDTNEHGKFEQVDDDDEMRWNNEHEIVRNEMNTSKLMCEMALGLSVCEIWKWKKTNCYGDNTM